MKPKTLLILLTISQSVAAQPQQQVYTSDADFDQGKLKAINHHAPYNNQLQITQPYPTLWIANAGEDTVSKFNTETNKEVGRYRVWFGPQGQPGHYNHLGSAWSGASPSRTAVDGDGNVYVANRHFDNRPAEVIKILTKGGIDRNGNGKIDTSEDKNNNGRIEPNEILPMADSNQNGQIDPAEIQDERIAWVTRVGSPGGLGRALCIDTQGKIWMGLYNHQVYYQLEPNQGKIIGGSVATPGLSPYGCLIDRDGQLWSASLGSKLGQLDTLQRRFITNHTHQGSHYGIGLGNQRVYLASRSSQSFIEFDPNSKQFRYPAQKKFSSLGVAVDRQQNIVVGNSGGGVTKFAPNGRVIWSANAQANTGEVRGIAIDRNNDVWAIHRNTDNISKFRGTDGTHLGVFPVGNSPYTYSDAVGFTFQTVTSGDSIWSVIFDSGKANTTWQKITWNQEPEGKLPRGSSLYVEIYATDQKDQLQSLKYYDYLAAYNARTLKKVEGRYLKVRVFFQPNEDNHSPILSDLTLTYE